MLSSSHLTQHGFDMDGMFGKPKPSNRTNDSVALYRYMDVSYSLFNSSWKSLTVMTFQNEFYGVVEIGHKAQKFNLLFDTAWTESWVISKDCSWKTPGCCKYIFQKRVLNYICFCCTTENLVWKSKVTWSDCLLMHIVLH